MGKIKSKHSTTYLTDGICMIIIRFWKMFRKNSDEIFLTHYK